MNAAARLLLVEEAAQIGRADTYERPAQHEILYIAQLRVGEPVKPVGRKHMPSQRSDGGKDNKENQNDKYIQANTD